MNININLEALYTRLNKNSERNLATYRYKGMMRDSFFSTLINKTNICT